MWTAIGTGQWLTAASLVTGIEEKCLGYRTEGLWRELGEETWAADRERTRPEFNSHSGQWVHWRYYARTMKGDGFTKAERQTGSEQR